MTSDAQGAHPGAHVHSGTVSGHAPADAIIISDAHLLFTGDFKRAGVDLVVSGDGHEVVLHDYFKGEKRAALASPDGAHLTGDIISALTGHTQFAQADGSPSVAQVIGHVTKLTGTATAIRNGVSIILNQGDNVNKGDVVASGSDSTLGITFIDGTVFGLASNAKMVLNEMIYDPNGSDNKSLISLVAGTISFVAGATAKHGDMKVDTPVATMGIRGTAVLVEIDFTVPASGGAPPAKFQVLVEPDGTTGSYILFDKVTLTPIATVNQAGTQTIVNGQGGVNFLSSAQLSADAQKIITDVFALKFSDLNNPNTKQATNFTDSVTQEYLTVRTANNQDVSVKVLTVNVADKTPDPHSGTNPSSGVHIPGPPSVTTHNGAMTERALTTGSAALDTVIGTVDYNDINPGDAPTVKTRFDSFAYQNAGHADVTAALTATQLAAIKAVEAPLITVQDIAGLNVGTATWAYVIADGAFDFLAAGEVLTLTYIAHVDNNFALNNESREVSFTITITGTNDTPVVTSSTQAAAITELLTTHDSTAPDTATGTVKFVDADLTDTHAVTITGVAITGVTTGLADNATVKGWLSLAALTDSTDGVTGSRNWTFSAQDKSFDYLAVGETVTFTYTVQVDDHHGGVVTQPVTITITGTNDTPVITSGTQAVTLDEIAGTHDSATPDAATGTVTFTDLDLSDIHDVTITGMVASGTTTALDSSAASWLTLGVLHDSTTGVTGSDVWSFSAADHYFDYLAEGEHVTLTYTVQVDDHHGGVVTQQVAVTIDGSNDAPVAHADSDIGTIIEAGNTPNDDIVPGVATTTGNVLDNDTDLDLSDTHSVVGVVSGTATAVLAGGVGTSINGIYGWLTLNSNGTWTYTLDNARSATNSLAQGAHVTDVFSYTDADNHGGTSTTTLTIGITGTNDAPVTNTDPFAVTDTNTGAPVVEKGVNPGNTAFGGVDHASGNVLANDFDIDTGDFKTVQGVASGTPTGLQTDHVGTAVAGTYGKVTISDTGVWTYTLDNDAATTQGLAQGEHVTDVFTYTMHDAHGATSSATLTIDIAGTNDAPVAVADGNASDAVVEAGVKPNGNTPEPGDATAAGNVLTNDTDIDTGHTLTVAAVGGVATDVGHAVAGTYGSVIINTDGSYTYTLDNADADTQALAQGDTATDVFQYTTTDEHGATSTSTLTITITGTNDSPVVAAALSDSVNEGAALVHHDLLDGATDVDHGETASLSVSNLKFAVDTGVASATLPPGVTLGADGHTLTVDPTNPAYDHLSVNEQTVITVSYNVQDVHGATVAQTETITIHGTNDAPTLAAVNTAPIVDTSADDSFTAITGTLVGNDVDDGETAGLRYAAIDSAHHAVNTAIAGTYGSLTVDLNGHYQYSPNAAAINALSLGNYTDTFTVQTTDAQGAVGTASITVNITGANDGPVAHDFSIADGTEDTDTTLTTAQLLAHATDVDSTLTVTSVSAASAHGGTVSLVGNIVSYRAAANFAGTDSFTYTVSDGSLTSTATASFNVAPVADTFTGTAANDTFFGYGGNDTFDGLAAFDRVNYINATGAITANLAAGTVDVAGVGTDHLVAIEGIRGSNFADTFDATGFTGNAFIPGTPIGFNEFEGRGGNDSITGIVNSQGALLTRVSYVNSTGAVTVDFANHFADGNSSVGHDTFLGTIGQVIGSAFSDTFTGSNNPSNTVEVFDGRAGNDAINGAGGFDRADYAGDSTTTSGITVNLAAGTVAAIDPSDLTIGNDSLSSVESIRGTNHNDIYDATGFGSGSANSGSLGTFNEFNGMGGNDQIIGNGNTRLAFINATAAVVVDLQTGWISPTAGGTPGTGTATGGDPSVGSYTFSGVNSVMGSEFADTIRGSNNNDTFYGQAGNDSIDGRGGFDIASYNNIYFTTGGVTVTMSSGTVVGDSSVGTDTLRSIEGVQGTGFDDSYDATGFGVSGANVGSNGTFNQFEGLGGNDTITGNGNTRVIYVNAAASVTVDIAAGTGQGTIAGDAAHVGQDHFVTAVNSIMGSSFGDFLYGSDNATGTTETFDGRAGDDFIDGRGGFDLVVYNLDTSIDAGITVDMASGTVTSTSSAVGTDTLRSIESITGTRFADIYVATGFSGSSTNAGSSGTLGTFNSFNGFGGGDTITGNGNTTIVYSNAASGVTADLQTGIATSAGDAGFGIDHFTGVNGITGSNFADILTGDSGNNRFTGRGGDDFLTGGAGSDTFVFSTGDGADTISDFTHAQDKIDLTGLTGILNLNDVMAHATQVGPNTVIDFGFGDSITLTNVTKTALSAADFVFGNTPYLNGDAIMVTESNNHSGITTVQNVTLTDDTPLSNVVLTATAGSGSLAPASVTDTVGNINAAFATGIVYTPTNYQEATNLNDTVTITATDLQGHSDSLHFVFQQSGSGGATLVGTAGKDIIFSTGGDDMLTGLGDRDNFVFAPHGGTPSHDTITDFTVGLDKLDVRAFGALLSTSPPAAVQQGSDTLITLDADDTVLLRNVSVSSLHNSDFIFHI